ASDRSRASRERVANVLVKLLIALVEADDRPSWVVRFVVEIEDVLHSVDERGVVAGLDHPRG
ncbi:hypothetical protein, partial [Saliphagus infecundisoli]|uniref:hypothetical protein n=1 Tax=Saliphagus infecundisoli TaxID=1849069 RepID=UPI001CD7D12F